MMKKVISALIILIAGASTVAFLGPYLRQVKFDTTASLTASPTTYDCADGSCIGFIVRQVTPSGFSSYEGKLLFPYDTEIGKDQLQNQWAHLLNNGEKVICLEGFSINIQSIPYAYFNLVMGDTAFN